MGKVWISDVRKNLLCVDSYDNGVLKGRLYSPLQESVGFSSLSQFLLAMEELLEGMQCPQSYTIPRRFSEVPDGYALSQLSPSQRKGALATFELSVLFRQNTSWQGMLQWREAGKEQSFRSVLELVLLMDSALRGGDAP